MTQITYVILNDKFLYLSVVIDLFSRRVVGWSINDTLEPKAVVAALEMAFAREINNAGVIFQSDQGVQYASSDFRELFDNKKVIPRMSRKGNCYDNTFTEN